MLYFKLILTAVFWGGTFVAGRIAAREMGPFSAAFLRFVMASVFLFGFAFKSHGRIPTLDRKQFFFVVLLGLTGVFAYNACFFSGLKTITASRASLIIASQPAFIALLSSWLFRERLDSLKIPGIMLSIAGAVTVISHGHPLTIFSNSVGPGELFILGCVASWVAYSLIGKAAMKSLSPLLAVTWSCGIGAVCLLPFALAEGVFRNIGGFSLMAWLGILYLGFFGSALGFIWYYEGIKAIGPARAGIFINLVPVSAVVLAYLMLGETLDASLVAGAVLVISGVYLMNRSPLLGCASASAVGSSCRR
jgi:drug/metabolite transporter (DMT)-like permease